MGSAESIICLFGMLMIVVDRQRLGEWVVKPYQAFLASRPDIANKLPFESVTSLKFNDE